MDQNVGVRSDDHTKAVVSVIPRDLEGRVLVLQQRGGAGKLIPALPGGCVEPGETHTYAFRRESFEELGIAVTKNLQSADYQVTLHRQDEVVSASVFERLCPEFGGEVLRPRSDDKVESAGWLSTENALRLFLESPARHISEPLVSFLSGHVGSTCWRYDSESAHIPITRVASTSASACVSGHFEVRGSHTELLGVPARYLLKPSMLMSAATVVAALIRPYEPQSLVTPAVGGVALASAVAIKLDLPLAIVERTPGGGYDHSRGARISRRSALIDSTYHSGETLKAMQDFIEETGGNLVACAVAVKSVVANRQPEFRVPIPVHALENILVHSWRPEACPLCLAGKPLDRRPLRYERNSLC